MLKTESLVMHSPRSKTAAIFILLRSLHKPKLLSIESMDQINYHIDIFNS